MRSPTPLFPIIVAKLLGGGGGSGLTDAVKQAMLQCFDDVAWKDDESGASDIAALEAALYPVESITAVYTQSGIVYDTDSLDSLKSDLVVTAYYENGSTATVAAANYTLSGTLTEGTSTITVTYLGKTATFTVTVTHNDILYALPSAFTSSGSNSIDTGVAFETEKNYSVVCSFSVSQFATSTKFIYGDMTAGATNYMALQAMKVTSGVEAGTYVWGSGIGYAVGKDFAAENDQIRFVLTLNIGADGYIRDAYLSNKTSGVNKTATATKTDVLAFVGQNVLLGKQASDYDGFSGTITDFKIYDRILTAEEISAYLG